MPPPPTRTIGPAVGNVTAGAVVVCSSAVVDVVDDDTPDWAMESWDGEQDGGNVDGLLEVASESSSSVVSDEVLLQTNLGDDFLSLFHHH